MATGVAALSVLDFGRANIDLGFVMAPGDMDGVWEVCPFPGFLLHLEDGRRILVDTGPNRRHIREPMFEYGDSEFSRRLQPQLTGEDDPVNRLAEVGLSISDLDMLILTHTHFDHAGNTADFAGIEVLIHRDAYEFGRQRWQDGIPGGIPDIASDGTPLNYHLIDGDHQVVPGLMLLETPGHAPGHLSLFIELEETGPVILAIDAIYAGVNRERDNYQVAFDSAQARASAMRLIELAERENARLIYGHDPGQWREIRKAPEVYR